RTSLPPVPPGWDRWPRRVPSRPPRPRTRGRVPSPRLGTDSLPRAGSLPEHPSEEAIVGVVNVSGEIPGPRSKAILARKERVVCDPLDIHVPAVIDRALGATFTDVDGNTFLDLSGGLGCHL